VGKVFTINDTGRDMNRLRQLMREHGVEKHFTLHDLRRTFAVKLTERGAPITVVAHALGHSSTTATPIYTQAVSPDAVRAYY
jgi:site-specific recombinase XerD